MDYQIERYIDAHLDSEIKHLPLIFFSQEHLNHALYYLDKHYFFKDSPKVDHMKNVLIRCKHFPYECSDLPDKHRSYNYDRCQCIGLCLCDNATPIMYSYLEFSWSGPYMEHKDNCYDDCCSFSKIYNYFRVTIDIVDMIKL